MPVKKIALIIGSTRAVRVGPHVADFVHKTLLSSNITPTPSITVIDLATWALPLYNETVMPAMVPTQASFTHPHSIAWSAEISYDAYIFVSAEYNYGLPAGIKNAIDYLYNELIGKLAMIVTYGIHGGYMSSRNLKETLEGMKLRIVETRPELKFGVREWRRHLRRLGEYWERKV